MYFGIHRLNFPKNLHSENFLSQSWKNIKQNLRNFADLGP